MAITVDDVRRQMSDVIEDQVSDEVINQQIEISRTLVDEVKSKSASKSLVEHAVLLQATYLSYLSYAEAVRREVGEMPIALELQLERYDELSNRFLDIVERREKHYAQKGVSSRSSGGV